MDKIVYEAYEELEKYANCPGEYVSFAEMDELLKYLKEKEYYNENLLRVVMVGRTNAGKSKLTNAFVGKNIAPVRGRELTSWNTNFWPSDTEYCIGTNTVDKVEKISVEKYVDIMNSKEKRRNYLQDKKSIDVFFTTEDIRFAILDVPGFMTQKKENEILAFEAIREADVVLLVIPGDVSISGDDIALYEELKKNKKPVEIIVTKADCRTTEELQSMKSEIQQVFQLEQEIFSISSNLCLKGDKAALSDRKRIIERINQYQVLEKETRKRRNASFESECISKLKKLQEKVLRDIDRKFAKKYEEQAGLYKKAEHLTQMVREELKQSTKELYCAPFKDAIVKRMTSISIEECKTQVNAIIHECVPESYMIEYWQKEADYIRKLSEDMWEKEIGDSMELSQYVDVLRKGREWVGTFQIGTADAERVLGGVGTAAGLGTVVSFYQAVLGPAAQYITMAGAMTSVGLPLVAIGTGLSVVISMISNTGRDKMSEAEAKNILSEELKKNSNEIIFYFIDVIESQNKAYIHKEIQQQELKLLQSLPEEFLDADAAINALEGLGARLFNRELALAEKIHFYMNTPIEQLSKVEYIDPVEQKIDDFIRKLDALKAPCYIDTSNSIPFMPILFLSDENKEHLFHVLAEICSHSVAFEKKIKDTQFEFSYIYEDEICKIYYSHEANKKVIKLEYIDVFSRDISNVRLFEKKIREGCVLSDCQMRRKIISDISRAKERVEILVPWMNGAMYTKSKYYRANMFDTIGQALKNGATVIIGCGNSEEKGKENEEKSRTMKEKLEAEYKSYCDSKKLIFHMNSFTHEKFLVVDNRIAMCGSYNFLSNNGKFEDKRLGQSNVKKGYNFGGSNGGSSESEHPGESMKITENVEGIQLILARMRQKYS